MTSDGEFSQASHALLGQRGRWQMDGAQRTWLIDSVNANSWKTAKSSILQLTAADIVALQEHKVPGNEARAEVARQGRALGWKALASAAHPTGATR
eukprot:6108103-Karenia_brevis.AAC.1